ncbi:MAG: IPExxxVDY family protein [Flammeovirgaceae bacterium TMED290]|nr:MAG: IPExxxVDY family protein [Flammeovirgaceae bacterium TMED290]|tara:strand:+ start:13388 stop:13813 length:426 start_codon:yes stop_codon:yes gene_type:complete
MIINENNDFSDDSFNYELIGLVSTSKEYQIAWHLNKLLDIMLVKKKDEIINLIDGSKIMISYLEFKFERKHIKLISNRLKNSNRSYLVSALSNFDFFILYSKKFFEFKDYDIIKRLKSNNTFQFANFVDINKIKDNYFLSL